MRFTYEEELVGTLRRRCEKSQQKIVAKELGFSPTFINQVLNGQRPVTKGLAAALGYERMVIFREVQGDS